jgi:hypothetical protein
LKEIEPKKWKKNELKKAKKKVPREEDFYLKITEHGKSKYRTKCTKEDAKAGSLPLPDEAVEEIMKAQGVKNWDELEFIPSIKGKNQIVFEIRKKATYIL